MTRDEARENLEKAIKEYVETFESYEEDPGLLIDWLLITAHHIADESGTATANGIYGPPDQRLYGAAGLVAYAKLKVEAMFLGRD